MFKVKVSSLLTLNISCSSISIVNFEQVNTGWVRKQTSRFQLQPCLNICDLSMNAMH